VILDDKEILFLLRDKQAAQGPLSDSNISKMSFFVSIRARCPQTVHEQAPIHFPLTCESTKAFVNPRLHTDNIKLHTCQYHTMKTHRSASVVCDLFFLFVVVFAVVRRVTVIVITDSVIDFKFDDLDGKGLLSACHNESP
jgi:hypothetical protein